MSEICHVRGKEDDVKTKTSVILPLSNAEAEFVLFVHDCFEISDDILVECVNAIIDDVSSDVSGDIVEKLSLEYPQIKAISQWSCQGIQKAILNGLRQVDSDLLYIEYTYSGFHVSHISTFYRAMTHADTVFGRFNGEERENGYIETGMIKKPTLQILGKSLTSPEEAMSILNENQIPCLELPYVICKNRNPLKLVGLPPMISMIRSFNHIGCRPFDPLA